VDIAIVEMDLVAIPGAEAGKGRGAIADLAKTFGGDEGRHAEAEAAHGRIGQGAEGAADLEFGATEAKTVADGKAKLIEHDAIDERAMGVVDLGEEFGDGLAGGELRAGDAAEQGIIGADGADIGKG